MCRKNQKITEELSILRKSEESGSFLHVYKREQPLTGFLKKQINIKYLRKKGKNQDGSQS
jgi:hypothetical protein